MAPDTRVAVLAANLERVRQRLAAACAAANRSPDDVTLIAVTKYFPASDVLHLRDLGVLQMGENRDQEAAAKSARVAEAGALVDWHFIGQLQRNKCASVVTYASAVHSVDSVRLAQALGRAASRVRREPLNVLVQVNLDQDPQRGGVDPQDELAQVADAIAGSEPLRLRGLMAVAPLVWEPEAAFARLAEIAQRLRVSHPQADWISAGMSGDLAVAVAYGSTHVRVGSALLGKRPPLR
jgi:PLP dependent protein